MSQLQSQGWNHAGRSWQYGLAGMVAGILITVCWVAPPRGGVTALAQTPAYGQEFAQPGNAGNMSNVGNAGPRGMSMGKTDDTIAFTTPGPTLTSQRLFILDTQRKAFVIYRLDANAPNGIVKLEAAREYRWDLGLSSYNNQPPDVAAVEAMVKSNTRRN